MPFLDFSAFSFPSAPRFDGSQPLDQLTRFCVLPQEMASAVQAALADGSYQAASRHPMHTALHAGGHGWQGEDGVDTLDALNEAAAAAAVRHSSIPKLECC